MTGDCRAKVSRREKKTADNKFFTRIEKPASNILWESRTTRGKQDRKGEHGKFEKIKLEGCGDPKTTQFQVARKKKERGKGRKATTEGSEREGVRKSHALSSYDEGRFFATCGGLEKIKKADDASREQRSGALLKGLSSARRQLRSSSSRL